jgi:hypothetical protein
VFTARRPNSGYVFAVVGKNFAPFRGPAVMGFLPSEKECERWLGSGAEVVGFRCVHGLSIEREAAVISTGSLEREEPLRLSPCSDKDEAILYEQNRLVSYFNVVLLQNIFSV